MCLATLPATGAVSVTYGPPTTIRADKGELSFGSIMSLDVVSWSAPGAKDVLISRLWDGVFLYPSRDLKAFGDPIRLCETLGKAALSIVPYDWSGRGAQDAIGMDREGQIFCLRKTGKFPDLHLEFAGFIKYEGDGLQMRIPFDNPNHKLSSAGGYVNTEVENYIWAAPYPGGSGQPTDLVVGDWAGQLWWLPQKGTIGGLPTYPGESYRLSNGKTFVRPKLRVLDETAKPFLLGTAVENGESYIGCDTRPLAYRDPQTGSQDLMVRAGLFKQELHYLKRLRSDSGGVPVFTDLGEVELDGGNPASQGCYSRMALVPGGRWSDLLISHGSGVAVCRNKRKAGSKPSFKFEGIISGKDVATAGYGFIEILKDVSGKRFILDDGGWEFRELIDTPKGVRLSSEKHILQDQNGPFHLAGETDPNWSSGFDRGALWDYDGSGKQNLIVGSDKGNLWLLKQDKPLGVGGKFEFTTIGPLKDSSGKVIKVHNRVSAAAIDLDGDGRLDLALGGATYQMGTKTDPTPGSGIYYTRNLGLDSSGVPILSPVLPLETVGHKHAFGMNQHAQLQALDLFGTGERVLIVATQEDGFRGYVYRPAKGRIALEPTGTVLPGFSVADRILDIDGDGKLEHIISGGEVQIGSYSKLVFTGSPDR